MTGNSPIAIKIQSDKLFMIQPAMKYSFYNKRMKKSSLLQRKIKKHSFKITRYTSVYMECHLWCSKQVRNRVQFHLQLCDKVYQKLNGVACLFLWRHEQTAIHPKLRHACLSTGLAVSSTNGRVCSPCQLLLLV